MAKDLPEGMKVNDLPPYERKKYKANHPSPATLKKYYEFADEYLSNGFHGPEAWMTTHPNCNRNTAKQMASIVLCYNDEIKEYVAKGKKEVTSQFDLDWCSQKLAEIVDGDETADKDKIAAIKGIQAAIFKLKELEAKDKEDDKQKIEVKLVD